MPRVKQTPLVRLALYGLALYVAVMLTLIAVNFHRFIAHSGAPAAAPTSAPAPTTSAAGHPAEPH